MNTHLKYLFIFLSIGWSQLGGAQGLSSAVLTEIDSINLQIKNAKNKEEKIERIIELGKTYRKHNQSKPSIEVYKSALDLINADQSPNVYAKVNLVIGNQYLENTVFKTDSALVYIQNAYSKFDLLNERMQISCLQSTTWVHHALFRFEEAMQYCYRGIDLAKKAGQKDALRYFYTNMSIFNSIYIKDHEEIIRYSLLALDLAKEIGDRETIANAYLSHGNKLVEVDNYVAAFIVYDSCEKYIVPNVQPKLLLELQHRRGISYYFNNELNIAKKFFYKAWEIANRENVQNRKMHIPLDLAEVFLSQGEFDKAIELSKNALTVVPDNLTLYELDKGNYQLYKAYKAKGNSEKALYYFETWKVFKDSMYKINNLSTITGLESKYKNKEQKQQIEHQQSEIKKQRKQKQLFGSLLSILSVLMIGLTILLIKIRNSRKRIKTQHKTITHQAEELKNLDKVKSRFFANVSHELRTPLTLILGPINSILKNADLNPDNLALLKTARQNGNEILMLVKSILDLSKMESGKLQVFEQPENLFKLTRKILRSFELLSTQKKIRLSYIFKTGKKLNLYLDKNKIDTILKNLISNAIKFTPMGGEVEIKIQDVNDSILISISDNGRGISAKELPYIFDRYFQTKNPEALAEGGSGIGLSLSKELANLMDSSIWAESKEGEGSTFYFKIPKKEVIKIEEKFDKEVEAINPRIPMEPKPSTKQNTNTSIVLTEEETLWIEKVEQFIKQQLSNHQYSIFQLAQDMIMSERQLRRKIKTLSGLSPTQYLKEARLQAARQLLEQRKFNTVAQTARAVGFLDPVAFSRNFSNRFGKLPSEFLLD